MKSRQRTDRQGRQGRKGTHATSTTRPAMRSALTAALAATLLIAAPQAAAQSGAWPNKPIRMIVASGAGGGLDLVARTVGTPIAESLGQNVVVDNRPGASGVIALATVPSLLDRFQ